MNGAELKSNVSAFSNQETSSFVLCVSEILRYKCLVWLSHFDFCLVC